jgi:hypothetical protein
LVAVDDVALLVGDHHAVGVAVERDADVGAAFAHFGAHRVRRGRANLTVDVEAVRTDADFDLFGAQFPQHLRRDLVGGAVRAIENDAQAVEPQVRRERALREFDVAGLRVVDTLGAAELIGRCQVVGEAVVHHLFDFGFDVVREFVTVGAEQLDAVVFIAVVGGRNHDAQIGA